MKNLFKKITANSQKKLEGSLLHITHWKAGSQWLHKILYDADPEKFISEDWRVADLSTKSIMPGKIYPALYLTHENFKKLETPPNCHRFVVIRDLRDTLISAYFSIRITHTVRDNPGMAGHRNIIQTMSIEEGLEFLTNQWLGGSAAIQNSWVKVDEPFIRYEDLLANDLEILLPIISKTTQIPESQITDAVIKNRFTSLTQGRERGEEDLTSHERKGMAGDWKNYFTSHLKHEFKNKFGDLLIKTGYEVDFNW